MHNSTQTYKVGITAGLLMQCRALHADFQQFSFTAIQKGELRNVIRDFCRCVFWSHSTGFYNVTKIITHKVHERTHLWLFIHNKHAKRVGNTGTTQNTGYKTGLRRMQALNNFLTSGDQLPHFRLVVNLVPQVGY